MEGFKQQEKRVRGVDGDPGVTFDEINELAGKLGVEVPEETQNMLKNSEDMFIPEEISILEDMDEAA